MRLTRQEDVSLYLYLKDCVIGPEFYEITSGDTLSQDSSVKWMINYTTRHPAPTDRGRGILSFDVCSGICNFGTEQSGVVSVYQGMTEATSYSVDYLGANIYTMQNLTGYNVDYCWHYVSVLDAWPYEDVPSLPIVSLELLEAYGSPYQLGGGEIRNGFWNIQIFASNKGERDDLMDTIYDKLRLRRCPVYRFENGLPLIRNGTFNTNFTANLHSNFKYLHFDSVKKSLSGLPSWGFYGSERINRNRAEITFNTLAYEN